MADRLEIQVSYAIGIAHPLSISIETFGTGKVDDEVILKLLNKHFDFRPGAIIDSLNLRRPIYKQIAAYGHFGRNDLDLPWERTDKSAALRAEAGIKKKTSKEK
jgi:S-adenosylmethionine synthetase